MQVVGEGNQRVQSSNLKLRNLKVEVLAQILGHCGSVKLLQDRRQRGGGEGKEKNEKKGRRERKANKSDRNSTASSLGCKTGVKGTRKSARDRTRLVGRSGEKERRLENDRSRIPT